MWPSVACLLFPFEARYGPSEANIVIVGFNSLSKTDQATLDFLGSL